MDDRTVNAVQARKRLVEDIAKIGGAFRERWSALADGSPKVAAACLARAALVTAQKVEELYGVENLLCDANFSKRPEHKRVKWPVLPTMFPELSAWLLSPAKDRTRQLYQILDNLDVASSNENKNDMEACSFKIFWEQVDLVSTRHEETSLVQWVRSQRSVLC